MTELPKDLIAKAHTPPHYSHDRASAKAQGKHFKEWMSAKEKEEKKSSDSVAEEACGFACASPSPLPVASAATSSVASTAALSPLSVEVEALFEKMAATMLVMTSSGEQETTLFLDGSQFSSSPFFGTRITIKEFSTAPKVFNVEIALQQAALHLLAAHTGSLLAAFESNRFAFSVHRLTTELQEENSLYYRRNQEENNDRKRDS
ncbi:MAG TPA: hypothetical protein VGJ00_05095 [Rhabdochlamydiaceae bacterium]|jgi:hypothetical protein